MDYQIRIFNFFSKESRRAHRQSEQSADRGPAKGIPVIYIEVVARRQDTGARHSGPGYSASRRCGAYQAPDGAVFSLPI